MSASGGRAKSSAPSAPSPPTFRQAIGAESCALLATATLLSFIWLAPDLRAQHSPTLSDANRDWLFATWMLPAASILVLLLPATAVGLWGWKSQRSLADWASATLAFLGLGVLFADNVLYQRFGRHLADILIYIGLPSADAAAGSARSNLLLFGTVFVWSLISAIGFLAIRRLLRHLFRKAGSFSSGVFASLSSLSVGLAVSSLWVLIPILPDGFGPRLVASLAIRPASFGIASDYTPHDPKLAELQAKLRDDYERLFPFVFKTHTQRKASPTREKAPPNVHLIVAESLRFDQLTPELMPRLFAWSKRGLRASRHYAGSNHSEAGLFILLYGQSPLRFNTTLDQEIEPTLCRLIRPSGYRCGYYTGHPKIWLRREEFLNNQTMDDFVHSESGTWNDWDQRALASASQHLNDGTRRFALTFLMSSHFEYRYPKEYRVALPDDPPSTSWLPGQARPHEFLACKNRYNNVTRYLDDLVADHIESLDPTKTLVVFTGDHGESTGEDGRFGHGYSFSDPLTRVPFVMVGPGVEPGSRKALTSHLDVLPTVLHAIGLPSTKDSLGQPFQTPPTQRSLLSSYTTIGRPIADGLLIDGNLRLKIRFDPVRPEVDVLGLEDPSGRPDKRQLSDAEVQSLSRAFRQQLERTGRPVF